VVKLFQRSSDKAATSDEPLPQTVGVPTKGHATPTRKEREAARKRPLVGANTPEARKASRAALQSSRERARVGMLNGEEKYLPVKDRGVQKRWVRDYVDARWSFGELLLPLAGVLLLALLVNQSLQASLTFGFYAYVLIVIIDAFVFTARLNTKLKAKFGEGNVEKFRMYAGLRSIYFRQLRTPKPQAKRGQFPK
jgi:hypothetical protein